MLRLRHHRKAPKRYLTFKKPKVKNRNIFRQLIEFKYDSIIGYNSFVENIIEKSVYELDKRYEEFIKSNPKYEDSDDEEYLDYYSSFVDDLAYESQKLSKDILQNHRKSIVFHFYSLLEKELYQIAGIIGSENIFKITDLKGNSVFEQFKLYLKKIEPELLVEIRNDLLYFDRVRLVRNFITHHDSIIRSDNQHFNKIKEFHLDRFTLLLVGTNKEGINVFRFEFDRQDFIKEIFDNFKIFIEKIYK